MNTLRGKRILVTGATGFVGNRTVERLILEHGAEVVALVHQFRNASRLARFPLRMIGGDVTDEACVRKAAEGCDAIVHAAVAFSGTPQDNRRVTVEGTRHVCEAAKAAGARLIHFSTLSVYGKTAPGPMREDAPKHPGKDAYGAGKWEAERLVQRYQEQGVEATILQPTIVYGPWSFWSTHVVRQLMHGVVALPNEGAGLCNAVYIDDVVDALFLCLQRKCVAPGPFLISAAAPVSWRDYYLAHAVALPGAAVAGMTGEEENDLAGSGLNLRSLLRPILTPVLLYHLKGLGREIPGLQRAMDSVPGVGRVYMGMKRKLLPENSTKLRSIQGPTVRPRVLPLKEHLALLRSQTEVCIKRAGDEIGYHPKFDLRLGGGLTAQWVRWAGFAPLAAG